MTKRMAFRMFCATLVLGCLLFGGHSALAQDRMYFTGMVETNLDSGDAQVVLVWGPLEQAIPSEIDAFRLYRKQGAGSFALVAEMNRGLVSVNQLQTFFEEPGEALRRLALEEWAFSDSSGVASGTDVYSYAHQVMARVPGDENYNPLQQFLLSRSNIGIARSIAQAYIDRTVAPSTTYEYMLTGMIGGAETLPLGQVSVDTSAVSVLPAPMDFEQVLVGGCSTISRGVDDRRIHFRWSIPQTADFLKNRILTYGYDLYRSDVDLGALDLRTAIPPELTKINNLPIVVAGPPDETGRDSFLAIDEGQIETHQFLQRGQTYYYYLVARDLLGHYSATAGSLEAKVPDALSPPAPWNVRTQEVPDSVDPSLAYLEIVWDEVNPANYMRQFSAGRQFVPTPVYGKSNELYFVPNNVSALSRNYREVDLEVTRYLLFRFDNQEAATSWGTDSDSDMWPDESENDAGTDPCDPTSHPAGTPSELVAEIPFADASTLVTLSNGVQQRQVVDTVPTANNHVFWYRLIAEDEFGNQSPLSPPVRGVLFDRTQPIPEAEVYRQRCFYQVEYQPECGNDFRFRMEDKTKEAIAAYTRIYEVCDVQGAFRYLFVKEKPLRERLAFFSLADFSDFGLCESRCSLEGGSRGTYVVRFYSRDGKLLAESERITMQLCNEKMGDCFYLNEDCRLVPVGPGGALDPGDMIHLCIPLNPRERARIYHELNGNMSPFMTVTATHSVGVVDYCEDIDLRALVPADACLGVRVFSPNNVGSIMQYLNCVSLSAYDQQPPDAPLLHSVEATGTPADPSFTVRWAAQSEGLSAFVLYTKRSSKTEYFTYWVNSDDLTYSNGLYEIELNISSGDVNLDWCFKVRAMDEILQTSDWSAELCELWELGDPEQLAWPPVPETAVGPNVVALFLNDQHTPQPVIVLSDDLGRIFAAQYCGIEFPPCTSRKEPCTQPISYMCTERCPCNLCDHVLAANKVGQFVVYRQDENRDFVQVSPLIDRIWCSKQAVEKDLFQETLDDPFVFLLSPDPATIIPPALQPEISGLRLVFTDNYPCRSGSKVRYQVMVMDPVSGEAIAARYSNWLQIP